MLNPAVMGLDTIGQTGRERHARTMRSLSSALDRIGDLVPAGAEIAYLDYPFHFNVGDQLINLGAEAFFARMRYRVAMRLSLFDLCQVDWEVPHNTRLKDAARAALSRLDPAAVLVLHGGGNFGDIYPEFQVMRELVAENFPDRRIVVLPQSLHFSSADAQAQSLARLLAHPDIHICVRDVASQAALRSHRPEAGLLLPDMAHALWATPGWSVPEGDAGRTLVLSRTDAESTGLELGAAAGGSVTRLDWPDIETKTDNVAFRIIRKTMAADLDGSYRLPVAAWYKLRNRLVHRAVRLYGEHGQIVTDRLHGMILAALLSRPVRYSDNSYGKLSRYVSAWLSSSPLVELIAQGAGMAAEPSP